MIYNINEIILIFGSSRQFLHFSNHQWYFQSWIEGGGRGHWGMMMILFQYSEEEDNFEWNDHTIATVPVLRIITSADVINDNYNNYLTIKYLNLICKEPLLSIVQHYLLSA